MGSSCCKPRNQSSFVQVDPPETFENRQYVMEQKAIVIQSHFRGHIQRKRYKAMEKKNQQQPTDTMEFGPQADSPTLHYPKPPFATKLNQTPTDYALTVQKALYRLGPFRYNDYINSEDPLKQSRNYQLSDEDKKLPFLDPHELENGSIYIGQWKNGLRHGKGKQIWTDGSVYEGFWKDNRACGIGRLIHSNGDIYIGDWKDDMCNGYGVYTHVDGTVYKGEWVNDKQHGYGVEEFPDGSIFRGQFLESTKHGEGEFRWPDNSAYKGEFQDNVIQGRGKYVWPDGRWYEGDWVNNQMHGYGEQRWPDGKIYLGYFKNDLKHGEGEFKYDENKTYKGQWVNGKQHGDGFIITKDQAKAGVWYEGKKLYWK